MSRIIEDRVAETTTTTGTGALTLAAAVAGFRRFSAVMSVSDTCYYMIEAINSGGVPTGEWETGLGTYSAANELTRTTVLESSNAGSAVSLSAGTKRVALVIPAAQFEEYRETVFLGQTDLTAASTADIALPAGYDSFEIEFYLKPGTDNVTLNGQVTDDNFSSVKSGATDYAYTQNRASASSTAASSSSGTTLLQFIAGQGNDVNEFNAGIIRVVNAKDATPTSVIANHNYVTTAAAWGTSYLNGCYKPTTVLNGLRLSYSSGTMTGHFKVWGRKG